MNDYKSNSNNNIDENETEFGDISFELLNRNKKLQILNKRVNDKERILYLTKTSGKEPQYYDYDHLTTLF